MKKALSILFAVLGLILVIVIAAPFLISWNQYKELIQREAYKATGREILIEGDVRFGLLPSPFAKLTNIVVKNPSGATSQNFATVKSVDVGVALAPLLSKQIQVTHINVVEPAVTLEIMANGQNNWQFTPVEAKEKTEEEKTADANNASGGLSIDKLTLEKAYLRYVDVPKKSQQMVGPLDGTFEVASLTGPFTGRGTVTVLEKLPVRFEAKVDSLPQEENGVIPFALGLNLVGGAANADLKGQYNKGNGAARVETALSVPHLDKILAALSKDGKTPDLPPFLKQRASVTGLLDWKDNTATIDNLQINSGGLEVLGNVTASLKDQTSIALDLNRVVLPNEMVSGGASSGSKSSAQKTLAQTLQESFQSAAGFLDTALPATPLNIVVTATQLPIPNQPTLRDVRIAASTSAKGATIQAIEAKLPGNTSLQVKGELPANAQGTIESATLNAHIVSQNIHAAMGKTAEDAMPVNLQTRLHLTRQSLALRPLEIIQNGQTVQGEVVYDPKASEALNVALKGSALNLDAFLGGDKKAASSKKTTAAKSTAASDPLAMLKGLRARITADLGSVTYQGKKANGVKLNAIASDAGLDLSQATVADLGGMVISANGKVGKLSPLADVNLQARAQTPNLSQTLRSLGNEAAQNLGASDFNAKVNGDAKNLNVALNGVIDQGKVAINGSAKNIDTALGFTGSVDITHPETATIVRNFGGLKPTTNLGAFALQTKVAYGTDTIKAEDLLVKLGSAGTLQGFVTIVPKDQGRQINAKLSADKLALAALMGDGNETTAQQAQAKPVTQNQDWSKEPINLEALRGLNGNADITIGELLYQKFVVRHFKTTLAFANNSVNLSQLSGSLFDAGTFDISGQLAAGKQNEAHRGAFDIKIVKTDAKKLFEALGSQPFSEGTLDFNEKIQFTGASPFAIVNSLNGDGAFQITKGVVNGIDLDALADKLDRPNSLTDFAAIIDQARAGGQTPIGDVTIPVTIRNGVIQVQNTVIRTQKTQLGLNGVVSLPPKTVNLSGQIAFTEQRNLPPLTLLVSGPMASPNKSFDTRSFTQFYAQKATEKLQDKAQDKINKLLGIKEPKAQPVAPAAPAVTPDASGAATGVTPPSQPDAPTAANPEQPAAPTKKQSRDDALKELGGQMLNNLLGGGR